MSTYIPEFNYSPDFQETWVKSLEKDPELITLDNNFKGLGFVKQLFRNHPELFGDNGSTLFYIQHAGRRVKANYLYNIFEMFVTNPPKDIVRAKLNDIPLYTVSGQDPIIQWARYLQTTSKFTIFEPSMATNNMALKSFIGNSKEFMYKNIPMTVSKIKPLCVTHIGENIAELLIYVAYLYNFFINCSPYMFNEVATGSSEQAFLLMVEEHINEEFNKLITLGRRLTNTVMVRTVDDLYNDYKRIRVFDTSDVKKTLTNILSTRIIMDLRNKVLRKDDPDLHHAISSQNDITQEHCYKGFLSVFSNLVDIMVKNNFFFKKILSNFPTFNENNYSLHELIMLTSWYVSGAKYPFIINDYEQYECCIDPTAVENYPQIHPFTKLQKVPARTISAPSLVHNSKPFTSSNVFLDIINGYLMQEFEKYQSDVFSHQPILVDGPTLDSDEDLCEIINCVYLNGKYALSTKQIKNCLEYLNQHAPEFNEEYTSVILLGKLCSVVYDNIFASMFLPAYILSFLPLHLAKFMNNNSIMKNGTNSLDKFSFVEFFCMNFDEIDTNIVAKLANIEMSLLFLRNKHYVKFINGCIDKITRYIVMDSVIVQPYVMGTSANVQMVPIGGISLGSRFIDTNPFSRGYYFVVNTQGNSEELFCFYNFIKNASEKNIKSISYARSDKNIAMQTVLDIIWKDAVAEQSIPISLESFTVDPSKGTFHIKTGDYFKSLVTSNGLKVYDLLLDYAFNEILAKDNQEPKFFSRTIDLFQQVSRPMENCIMFGKEKIPCSINDRATEYELPVYSFSTVFSNVELAFVQPNGYNLLKVYTPNTEFAKNNLFFIFTQQSLLDDEHNILSDEFPKFNVYDSTYDGYANGVVKQDEKGDEDGTKSSSNIFGTNLSTNEVASKRLGDVVPTRNNTFSTNRMKIIGKDTVALDGRNKMTW